MAYEIEKAYGSTAREAMENLKAKFVEMGSREVYFIGEPSVIKKPEVTEEKRYEASQIIGT